MLRTSLEVVGASLHPRVRISKNKSSDPDLNRDEGIPNASCCQVTSSLVMDKLVEPGIIEIPNLPLARRMLCRLSYGPTYKNWLPVQASNLGPRV
jgi:hypothetical protein